MYTYTCTLTVYINLHGWGMGDFPRANPSLSMHKNLSHTCMHCIHIHYAPHVCIMYKHFSKGGGGSFYLATPNHTHFLLFSWPKGGSIICQCYSCLECTLGSKFLLAHTVADILHEEIFSSLNFRVQTCQRVGGGDYDSNYTCMIGTSRTAMLQAIGGHVHKAEAEEHVTTWGGGRNKN